MSYNLKYTNFTVPLQIFRAFRSIIPSFRKSPNTAKRLIQDADLVILRKMRIFER